ncbi:transporter, major facilitator family protein [Ostertagia ostertagi]
MENSGIAGQGHGVTWKKIFVVAILLAVNLLNYMDRFTIAGLLGRLQDYFLLNDKEAEEFIFFLLQTVFIVFFMLFAPICGYFGDRYNRKFIIIAGLIVWISGVMLSTFVGRDHFFVFLFLRGVVGIGEATYSTVAPTIIGDLFYGPMRSIALMVFYFAIPVGSGLGFIGGSSIALWTGSWQWGVRFTPLIGVLFLILIIFGLEEPKRGQAEHAQIEPSTLLQDLKYLISVRTYVLTTFGFTSVVFCVGAASWWTPQLMTYAYGIQHGIDDVPKDEVAHLSVIFGAITCCAGIVGIIAGSTIAQAWREGNWCFRASHRADAFVCAAGSFLAAPLLFTALMVASQSLNYAWHVIVTHRRASATAIQTLIGHLFGDASSPYIIGFISDAVRGDQTSSIAKYHALQYAMFLPNAVLILSIGCYLWATFYIVADHHRAKQEMHVDDEWASDVETLIANVQPGQDEGISNILFRETSWCLHFLALSMTEEAIALQRNRQTQSVHASNKEHDCYDSELHLDNVLKHLSFLRINIDSVLLPEENTFIERLYNEGSLYGFNLEYQFPCLENVSRSLKAPVRIPAKSFTMTNIQFRHRRVVLLQMNPEIIPFWNRHHLVIRLHVQLNTRGKFSASCFSTILNFFKLLNDFTRLLGHCVVPLAELLIPPFMICRDFNFIPAKGMTFEGSSLTIFQKQDQCRFVRESLQILLTYPIRFLKTKPLIMELLARMLWVSIPGVHTRWILTGNFALQCAPVHRQVSRRENERAPGANASSNSLCMRLADFHLYGMKEIGLFLLMPMFLSWEETVNFARQFVSVLAVLFGTGRHGFYICGERRNIIVKILHHDISGDMTLGFVSIPLPIEEAHRVDYEMVDLTGTAGLNGEVPIITMSMEASDVVRRPSSANRVQSSSSSWSEQQATSRGASPPLRSASTGPATMRSSHDEDYLIMATREELEEKLKRNLSDLDRMIRTIKE